MLKLFTILALMGSVTTATAQGMARCQPKEQMMKALQEKYGETRILQALTRNSQGQLLILHFWRNLETGTYTVTLTGPDGTMCMVSSGNTFQEIDGTDHTPNL